jgi:hypothetical protein
MNNFITNSQKKQLKTRLLELLSKSSELKFLIGFFYFSGLKELYEGLKLNNELTLKILVGLNVDKNIYGLFEYGDNDKKLSDDERIIFMNLLRNLLTQKIMTIKIFMNNQNFFFSSLKKIELL